MILRLLHPQGIVGLAVALCLGGLLLIQKGETRHWRKQSGQFEQLYRGEQAAFAGTVANYRAAADAARAADRAAAERVRAKQDSINERSQDALETRLADARARAANISSGRLRVEPPTAADSRAGGTASMPELSAAAARAPQGAGQDRLPATDKRAGFPEGQLGAGDALIATEQAIQLDELIEWVKAQASVRQN